jgi:hypothetical protein
MPADFCGIKPFTGHRFDRVTKEGADVTEFNSHCALSRKAGVPAAVSKGQRSPTSSSRSSRQF